jgi:hypothetical protein
VVLANHAPAGVERVRGHAQACLGEFLVLWKRIKERPFFVELFFPIYRDFLTLQKRITRRLGYILEALALGSVPFLDISLAEGHEEDV